MKSRRLKTGRAVVVAIAFVLLATSPAQGRQQQEEIARGRVIDKVVCKADPGQSYALYLPSHYTPEKRWPILYAFDPGAEGRVPVELFQEAAEKYGWIVVGSLNSQNGPMQGSIDASNALWKDTHTRFSVDDRRIYTTGFSGGARVAVWVAYLCQTCVAGVIACGAGFHQQIAPTPATPPASISFALFATVGTDDFNFGELKNLDDVLTVIGLPHRLAMFEGGHMWAPKEVLTRALGWMEMQAIKAGRRAKDDALVAELWQQDSERARALEAAKKSYDAYVAYRALVADFRGLRETIEFEKKLAQLKETAEVKQGLREEKDQIRRQQELTNQLIAYQERRKDVETRTLAFGEFKRVLGELRKKAGETEDSIERRISRRTLHDVFAYYYEGASNLIQRRKDLPLAVFKLEIATEIAENSSQLMFELATAYALNGEKKKALDALRRAVEKGFTDIARMNSSPALEDVRKESEYRKILDSMSQKP
jgi:poly(3-hydroxybutyrate) depolymerase